MLLVFKKNLLKLIVLTSVFLIATGCASETSVKETITSQQNTDNIDILAGLVDVEGEGISVTLIENEFDKDNPNSFIHTVDLIEIVNLLTNAGAEVISINDERLILTSKIEADEMMIKVNDNEYSSPFVIKAIGDPERLSSELELKDSYADLLRECLEVKIEINDKLFIPRYKENIHFEYAKPVK